MDWLQNTYHSKHIDPKHAHYCCKTNMAICHKNLGPLCKLITFCEMDVDIPAESVEFILKEQKTWKKFREKKNNADYHYLHYRSKLVNTLLHHYHNNVISHYQYRNSILIRDNQFIVIIAQH